MKTPIYNQKGTAVGEITLSESVFGVKWSGDLVHQVVSSILSTRRTGTAHTKNRGDVRGGGKKPWKQKGTGRARHGSRRSPIWRGGGTTFGPRTEKEYARKVNKGMKSKALATVLSQKYREGEILFLDTLSLAENKTALAKEIFSALGTIKGFESLKRKKTNALLIALPAKHAGVEKSFRNFGNIAIEEARNLNPADTLQYRFVAFVNPEESLKSFSPSPKKLTS